MKSTTPSKQSIIKVAIETAKQTRKCHGSKLHEVAPGERLVVVSGLLAQKQFCKVCAPSVLAIAIDELEHAVTEIQK